MSEQWDGVPQNPERDGWHWVSRPMHGVLPMQWLEIAGGGWVGNQNCILADEAARMNWRYLGPCLTHAEVAAAVQAEREACAAGLEAAAKRLRLRDAEDRGIPDHMGHSFEANAAEAWAKSIRARGNTSALDAVIQAAYREGWNDRESDFLSGAARIGLDDAAIKAAEARGMERAAAIAKRFGAKSRASRTVARVASKHLHAQLWDASADAAHDIEAAIRASITAEQEDGS